MYDILINAYRISINRLADDTSIWTCDRGRFWAKLKEVDGTAVGVLLGYGDDWHFEITDTGTLVNGGSITSYGDMVKQIAAVLSNE